MKKIATIPKTLQTLIIPLITVSSITVALPSRADTFASIAQIDLALNNFNQFPQGVGVIDDVNAIAIAEEGFAQNQIDRDTIFFAEDNTVFANANFQTISFGTGSQYNVETELSSILFGRFPIAAGNWFEFRAEGSLYLETFVETWPVGSASTFGGISLTLFDRLTQNSLPLVNFVSIINTNQDPQFNRDFFQAQISPYFDLMSYHEEVFLAQGNQETTRIDFTGVFQHFFEQETELDLVAVIESCTAGSNEVEICRTVPEPSNQLALILLVFFGSIGSLSSRIMKEIIQFTR